MGGLGITPIIENQRMGKTMKMKWKLVLWLVEIYTGT